MVEEVTMYLVIN